MVGTAAARPRLPAPTGTTWGRDGLVAEVCELLDGTAELVTLTGLGGVGKTRVAAEVAARVADLDIADDAEPTQLRGRPGPVLATSRTLLGLPGERVVPVPPLDATSAVELFGDVARTGGAVVRPRCPRRAASLRSATCWAACRWV